MTRPAPDGVTVRPCRPEEVPAVLDLLRRAGATASVTDTPEDVGRALGEAQAVLLVAEEGGELVGSALAGFDGWRGNLYRLAVEPGRRRRGIARALVARAEQFLSARGAKRVTALVERDHPDATSFWSAAGYAADPRIARFVRTL
jgi:ribosomal protein S18 acetylase RimI-like enzyme